jgi:hypothetical protein
MKLESHCRLHKIWTVSWAIEIQFTFPNLVSFNSSLISPPYLSLGRPGGLFPSCLEIKCRYDFIPPILAICLVHLILLCLIILLIGPLNEELKLFITFIIIYWKAVTKRKCTPRLSAYCTHFSRRLLRNEVNVVSRKFLCRHPTNFHYTYYSYINN